MRAGRDGPLRRAVHRCRPDYAAVVDAVRHAMTADADPVVGAHADRIDALVDQERFEEAGTVRDRLGAFLRGAARAQRFAPLSACPELGRRAPDRRRRLGARARAGTAGSPEPPA